MITSTSSKQVKRVQRLQKKGKYRKEEQLFVVEGIKMFLETPPGRIAMIYVGKSFHEKGGFVDKYSRFPFEIVENHVFAAMSDTSTPQGILCLVKMSSYSIDILNESDNPCCLVLEDLQDPGNIGTIMRTAEGAGVKAVILTAGSVDIYNPKVIRSTMGSIYRVPFVYLTNIEEIVKRLRHQNVTVYAAALEESVCYDQCDYQGATAFLIGNEGSGLSETAVKLADFRIRIPMEGKVESLNASIAAALLIYEAYRQRR